MTPAEARKKVLELVPQAKYMNLSGCHCIDDYYNDRYLSYAATNRGKAWIEAAQYLAEPPRRKNAKDNYNPEQHQKR
jgi:hypothetical protein